MKNETKSLISLNLVLIMVVSLLVTPFLTIEVEAAENNSQNQSAYEYVLVIDGVQYDATRNHNGNGWSYYFHAYNNSGCGNLQLDNYTGGAIYCPFKLNINCNGDISINSSNSIGLESLENIYIWMNGLDKCIIDSNFSINTTGGFPAIKAKELSITGSFTAYSENSAALIANDIKLNERIPSNIFVGTSESDAVKGIYKNQSYVCVDPIEYKMNFYANGGINASGEEKYTLIFNDGYCARINLYKYKNLFMKQNEIQVGWTEVQDDYNDMILLTDEYLFKYGKYEDDLYAVWSSDTLKAVTLSGYIENNYGEVDKVYPVNINDYFVLPNSHKAGCRFEGWETTEGHEIYAAGESIKITDNITLKAKYTPLVAIINGLEYDASQDNSNNELGWDYKVISDEGKIQLDLYSNYPGGLIKIPDNAHIHLEGVKNINGTSTNSAITVNGDVEITKYSKIGVVQEPCTIAGGTSSSAIIADGEITISVGNNETPIVFVGGINNPALKSNIDKINIRAGIFLAGEDKNKVNVVNKYSDERFVKVEDYEYSIYVNGNTTIPTIFDTIFDGEEFFVGWRNDSLMDDEVQWFMPGDEVNFPQRTRLVAQYFYKDKYLNEVEKKTSVLRLFGNGGVNGNNSKYSIFHASPSMLRVYLSDDEFTRSGYTLSGWNTAKNGEGISYPTNSHFDDKNYMSDIWMADLYAQWSKNGTSDSGNGGSISTGGSSSSPSSDENYEDTIKLINNSDESVNLEVNVDIDVDNNKCAKITIDENCIEKISHELENEVINQIVLTAKANDNVTKYDVSLPASLIKLAIQDKEIPIILNTKLFKFNITDIGLENNKDASIIASKNSDGSISIVKNFDERIYATIFDDSTNKDTLIYKINNDGVKEVIKKSFARKGEISFVVDDGSRFTLEENNKKYIDVSNSSWYKSSVDFVSSRNLFNGTGIDKFSPNSKMNRAMLVTILHRLENNPKQGDIKFSDVDKNQYFSDAIAWASYEGIIKGKGVNFAPYDNITREELAVVLYNYSEKYNINTNISRDIAVFEDSSDVSIWAQDAFKWAVGSGLINGKENNLLDPKGYATRAEVAIILQRLVENFFK